MLSNRSVGSPGGELHHREGGGAGSSASSPASAPGTAASSASSSSSSSSAARSRLDGRHVPSSGRSSGSGSGGGGGLGVGSVRLNRLLALALLLLATLTLLSGARLLMNSNTGPKYGLRGDLRLLQGRAADRGAASWRAGANASGAAGGGHDDDHGGSGGEYYRLAVVLPLAPDDDGSQAQAAVDALLAAGAACGEDAPPGAAAGGGRYGVFVYTAGDTPAELALAHRVLKQVKRLSAQAASAAAADAATEAAATAAGDATAPTPDGGSGGAGSSGSSSCFSEFGILSARLGSDGDGSDSYKLAYPEGANLMWLALLVGSGAASLQRFSHALWMEWDTRPVRPRWLDALYESLDGSCWMQGSPYVGAGMDGNVADPGTDATFHWWAPHMNGNAVYRLHDPTFALFIRAALGRESPTHFWRPFDTSLHRMLVTLPYSWRTYQAYSGRFCRSAAIAHLGYYVTHAERAAVAEDPAVVLVHGDAGSAGAKKLRLKFATGGRLADAHANATIVWHDEIPPSLRLSALVVVPSADALPAAVFALVAALQFVPHALEWVAAVPAPLAASVRAAVPRSVTVRAFTPLDEAAAPRPADAGDGSSVGDFSAAMAPLYADVLCPGADYVLHLGVDWVLTRPLLRRDVFALGRPVAQYHRLDFSSSRDMDERASDRCSLPTGPPAQPKLRPAKQVYTVDAADYVLPRGVYAAIRAAREWPLGVEASPDGCVPDADAGVAAAAAGGAGACCFNARRHAMAWLYGQRSGNLTWMFTNYRGSDPVATVPYGLTLVRPPLTCRHSASIIKAFNRTMATYPRGQRPSRAALMGVLDTCGKSRRS